MLVVPIVRTWRSRDWPLAMATVGIWMTLAFDVTSYYPIFMMYAFTTLGATHYVSMAPATEATAPARTSRGDRMLRPRTLFAVCCLVVGGGMAVWWYLPCNGASCATTRDFGVEFKVRPLLQAASPEDRATMLTRLRDLYPESI